MKYFIHLAYKGTHYNGWQRQPNHPSVQQTIEDALERMFGQKVNCIGCGRTDTGVHASQFFCHIKWNGPIDFNPVFRLNKMLPEDIAIHDFIPVTKGVHAQHDAISRTYTYRIHTRKDPFLSEVSTFYSADNLDVSRMQKATALLLQYNDYRSMCKQPDLYENTICNISSAILTSHNENRHLVFEITANRFLRGMVRILIGNILEVGYGRLPLEQFKDSLSTGTPAKYFNAAYPQGLYLSRVEYPFL